MKWAAVVFFFLLVAGNILPQTQNQIARYGNYFYLTNTIVVKLKKTAALTDINKKFLEQLNYELKQPVVTQVKNVFTGSGKLLKGTEQLSRIFCLTVNSSGDLPDLVKHISSLPEIEWAEPKYVRKLCYNPNDEAYASGKQQHLDVVKAKEAWEVTKGNKEIIIGIIDTGVDIDHPDLAENIFLNKNEIPANGKDEDDSGEFVDDIHGWDFGGTSGAPDNNPREDYATKNGYHGTHVAGIASAVTDNSFGISSLGFNCTLLPVKASQANHRDENDEPYIIFGPEGIKYAVDKGAKIICCSWGGYEFSKYEQEIINFAVSRGVLIVAAAGNDNTQQPFYPASYKGVLSVGWSNNDDTRSIASNYGKYVNVMAPGTGIYSTWPVISSQNPPFKFAGGSSMSAPLVAGLAGLVFSKYPNLTAEQAAERIRVTCDEIDQKNLPQYEKLLGAGRINAYKAVAEKDIYSIRATQTVFNNSNSNSLEVEDTTTADIEFTNYFKAVNDVRVTVSCKEPFVKFINSIFKTGYIGELGKIRNTSIRFIITKDAPPDTTTFFLLKYESADYSDFQWVRVNLNPSVVTHNNGKIIATITNNGGLGFSYDNKNAKGNGFRFLSGKNLLFEGALMLGTSANKLIDGARITKEQSKDFKILKPISLRENNQVNESYSVFNDENAGSSKLGIQTQFNSYTFNSASDNSYIILKFVLENTSQQEIKNLYLGYFMDWNLSDNYFNDSTTYDAADNFAYVINKDNIVVGATLLSQQKIGYAGINSNWHVGEIILDDGFQDEEKWYSISNGIIKDKVYGDVSFVISGGPVNLFSGKKETFAFAIAPASSKEELRQILKQSRQKYLSIPDNIDDTNPQIPGDYLLQQNYPNP
ncbi:MAG: S8 family serine peptidase, partial [Ignavibacteria bacterium]|nr:S8 family serine peptidase [Ignavibacteria bacterium]